MRQINFGGIMSQETARWLNTMTLIGQTDRRGKAWHYRAEDQGSESNHYTGAIPVEDVRRRLFDWRPVPRRVAVEVPATIDTMTHFGDQGEPLRWAVQSDRQAVAASDDHTVLGMFKSGYKIHEYDRWLLDNVSTILDDSLSISSAGLLKGRKIAWVEVSVPDTITTPEGVAFRPNLLAVTSSDGSLATTYKRTITATVCDNTLAAALNNVGQEIKIRHSSGSLNKIGTVRDALAIVHTTADEFAAQVAALTANVVTPYQFKFVIENMFPIKDDASKRGVTMAENARAEVSRMYRYDSRVAPWTGTAFGVLQAFNTWRHHEQGGVAGTTDDQRNANRAQRNALRAITGETDTEDARVLQVLAVAQS
jgi:phage/plasmid-like protein (TIGR03299 family)